jgi:hypothetical protein
MGARCFLLRPKLRVFAEPFSVSGGCNTEGYFAHNSIWWGGGELSYILSMDDVGWWVPLVTWFQFPIRATMLYGQKSDADPMPVTALAEATVLGFFPGRNGKPMEE